MTQHDPDHPLVAVHGSTVRALDRKTGRLRWQYETKRVVARLTLVNGRVFVLEDSCVLHCLDAASGGLLGTVAIDTVERTSCALVADGDVLYAATNRNVVAVDSAGQILWRTEVGGAFAARAGLAVPGQVAQPDFTGS